MCSQTSDLTKLQMFEPSVEEKQKVTPVAKKTAKRSSQLTFPQSYGWTFSPSLYLFFISIHSPSTFDPLFRGTL